MTRGGAKLWRPVPSTAGPDPFTHDEIVRLLAAAEEIGGPRWAVKVRAALQSGLRSSELRALSYASVDWATGKVEVRHSLTVSGERGPTKTAKSQRSASLLFPVCENVAAYTVGSTPESVAVLAQLQRVVPLDPEAPLFPSLRRPGQPMLKDEYRNLWARTVKKARVRFRSPHAMRDTCVSVLLSRNAPLVLVADQTGDSIPTLAKFYARYLPQTQPPAQPALPVRPLLAVAGSIAAQG